LMSWRQQSPPTFNRSHRLPCWRSSTIWRSVSRHVFRPVGDISNICCRKNCNVVRGTLLRSNFWDTLYIEFILQLLYVL
jgi:hypothetical protein